MPVQEKPPVQKPSGSNLLDSSGGNMLDFGSSQTSSPSPDKSGFGGLDLMGSDPVQPQAKPAP